MQLFVAAWVFYIGIASILLENQERATLVERTTVTDTSTITDITERVIRHGLGEDRRRQINTVAGKQLFFMI